jgi:acetamidase/formamidase
MATHTITPSRETVHGFFSRDLRPVRSVDSGDSVVLQTLNAGWKIGPAGSWTDEQNRLPWYDPSTDRGHALDGPIAVRGAKRGMALEVEIVDVRPGAWGESFGGGWSSEFNDRFGVTGGDGDAVTWALDGSTGLATATDGVAIPMRPFLGVMGMPPDEPGEHPTAPPRACGGNLDCKELTAGAKLYLPIPVEGALFSAGDGHAVQGDGEISGVAIECPMDAVELKLTLMSEMRIATPRAWTPKAWITLGFGENLDDAMYQAVNAMLDLIVELHGLTRKRALNLASLVVDTRITQVVNGVKGVHAVLPHGGI